MTKTILYLSLTSLLFWSCTSVKNTQKSLNRGQYDLTIQKALDKLSRNKNRKKSLEYATLLQNAFEKATQRDLNHITALKKENNPNHLEEMYHTYINLRSRQGKVRPILPLNFGSKKVNISFNDYTDDIISTKNQLCDFLYASALENYNKANNKEQYRNVYDQLKHLESYARNYKNTNDLLESSYQKGRIYCFISLENRTNQIIPRALEADILNINLFNNDSFWTSFHCERENNLTYDYEIKLNFEDIRISPERIQQEHRTFEKEITNEEYLVDEEGNRVKDEHGKEIKITTKETIVCHFHRFQQLKTADVSARVLIYDLVNQKTKDSFPLHSGVVFDHIYASREGDRRALNNDLLPLLDVVAIPFPTTEQMVYDASQDLKNQFKEIIGNSFL